MTECDAHIFMLRVGEFVSSLKPFEQVFDSCLSQNTCGGAVVGLFSDL